MGRYTRSRIIGDPRDGIENNKITNGANVSKRMYKVCFMNDYNAWHELEGGLDIHVGIVKQIKKVNTLKARFVNGYKMLINRRGY